MFSYCVHVVLDLQHAECSVTDAHKQYFFKSILNTSFSKLFIFHLHPVLCGDAPLCRCWKLLF